MILLVLYPYLYNYLLFVCLLLSFKGEVCDFCTTRITNWNETRPGFIGRTAISQANRWPRPNPLPLVEPMLHSAQTNRAMLQKMHTSPLRLGSMSYTVCLVEFERTCFYTLYITYIAVFIIWLVSKLHKCNEFISAEFFKYSWQLWMFTRPSWEQWLLKMIFSSCLHACSLAW